MQPSAWDNLGWIEIIVVGAMALGIGFWQLWSINREIAKDKKKETAGNTKSKHSQN